MEDLDIASGLDTPTLLSKEYAPTVIRRLLDRALGFDYGDDAARYNCLALVSLQKLANPL